ncbi:hypothetical protein DPMN_136745 [Dreissena polymorpha]|uniref:Uncharacterized protein n=1 Tax=Dreissena polymorpha TaxID=45954 RepID=A0A9D4G1F8_DREPO|nr:hypothetical protein DPMN_136745 [Dreissena polymorpha]
MRDMLANEWSFAGTNGEPEVLGSVTPFLNANYSASEMMESDLFIKYVCKTYNFRLEKYILQQCDDIHSTKTMV